MGRNESVARPLSVTFGVWGVFVLGLANIWGALRLWQQAPLLLSLGSTLNPWFRAGLAFGWGLLFLSLFWVMRRRQPRVRWLVPLGFLFFAAYHLGTSWWFARSALVRQGLWANAALYGLSLLVLVWALNRPAARRYLRMPSP